MILASNELVLFSRFEQSLRLLPPQAEACDCFPIIISKVAASFSLRFIFATRGRSYRSPKQQNQPLIVGASYNLRFLLCPT
jgi:hypothetical protein